MGTQPNYVELNRYAWNMRTSYHVQSAFYHVKEFTEGKSSLNEIELSLLGDVKGKTILHLQCHFGLDSLSLARMGAKVTGIDLSDKAIEEAKSLNNQLGLNATFICCNIYDLPQHLNDQFDIVFTSYGTISWLPDLQQWGNIIAHFLKPGGRFVFAEFHPVIWMYDNDFEKIAYKYFKADPIYETETGTYADKNAPIKYESVTWNHSLDEVFQTLLNNNLVIKDFQEYDYSPYACFNGVKEITPGKYIIEKFGDKIPMVYSIVAEKQ
jgi:2-polyprenyl-3-methyl-5-hydroxy-6-metoxy-1,4-benzoquinol methylase